MLPSRNSEGEEVELQAFSYVEGEDGTDGQLNPPKQKLNGIWLKY